MERTFSVTISSIGTDEIPKAVPSLSTKNRTIIKVHTLKAEFFEKYSIPADTIIHSLLDHFAAAILSLDSLALNVTDAGRLVPVINVATHQQKGVILIYSMKILKYFISKINVEPKAHMKFS